MIRVRNIKVNIDNNTSLDKIIEKKLNVKVLNYNIVKKSIDARKELLFVYTFDIEIDNEEEFLNKNKNIDIFKTPQEDYNFEITGTNPVTSRPIIVGSGPAGLFLGYVLAENGYKPLIIERGEKIEDRVKTVEKFWESNELNPDSNVQFGEGGAGTFSDGKLNTLVKDKRHIGRKVFEIFVENGAPEEIMYINKPHIGTDVLRKVIVNIRKKIISMGGEFRYNTKLTDINIDNNKINSIVVNNKDIISCDVLVLAIGHSSRDTFKLLYDKGILMKNKNFAVGLRIIHPQDMINKNQYGDKYKLLPPADYKLTYTSSNGRGVYSFCMCPGGYVVNASSEEKRLVVNGMSNYKRDGENANSALVVTVSSKDYGEGVLDGVEFQRKLEEKAYSIGNGVIPIQLYGDYKNNKISTKLGSITPSVMGKYSFGNLNDIFSEDINTSLVEGIEYFSTKVKNYNRDDSILLGVESRTSSPVIIIRDENFISSVSGIYPCGEGAGYAGGITTASIDGIKVFESIIKKYKK